MLTCPPGDRKTASEVGSTDTIRLKQAMAICEAYMGGQSTPVVMSVTAVHTMLRSNQDIAKVQSMDLKCMIRCAGYHF
jgi:hypothetical protein